jgi:hypothetical protein
MPAITLPNLTYVDIPAAVADPVATWLTANFADSCSYNSNNPRLSEIKRDGIPSVAVVRNPWARLLDAYNELSTQRSRIVIPQGLGTTPVNSYFDYDYLDFLTQFEGYADFKSWVRTLPDLKPWKNSWFTFTTQQTQWLDGQADYLLRHENLATDFRQIQDLLNCDAEFLVLKPTVYQHHYDAEARDLVASWFALDIAQWEYKF